jgi:sugar phosphate isomerase/epimerase
MILCDSDLRVSWGGVGAPLLARLAADSGYDGVAIGPRCGVGDLPALLAAAAGAGLFAPVVSAPLAAARPGPGRRLPYLAARDPEERAAAVALCEATWQGVSAFGARVTALDLGAVALGVGAAEVGRAFARRDLDGGQPGGRLLAAALEERRARSPAILDACRYSLDRLLRAAERHGLAVALEVAAGPWAAPSPREAVDLVAAYGAAVLGVVWDPARLEVLGALGAAPAPARRDALAAAVRLVRANEAVGIEAGFLPGLGDPAGGGEAPELPAAADTVVSGRPDSTPAEVAAARLLARRD